MRQVTKRLLDSAIKEEQDAQKFYSLIADMVENKETKNIFRKLSEDEKTHEKVLNAMNLDDFKSTSSLKIEGSDSGNSEDSEIRLDMTPAEGIKLAMVKEKEAHEFYKSLVPYALEKETVRLLEKLADEEHSHYQSLEKLLSEFTIMEDQ